MKPFYKNSTFVLFTIMFIATLFTGCEEVDFVFSNLSQKVEGSWRFDRVKFRPNWHIDGDEITHDFRHITFNFYDNHEMIIEYVDFDGVLKADFGYWEVERHEYCDVDNCDTECFLHFELDDPENGFFNYHTWEITHLGSGKIKAREQYNDGTYKFKLLQNY